MYGEGENCINKHLIDGLISTGIPPPLKFRNTKLSCTVCMRALAWRETSAGRLQVIKVRAVYVCVKLQGGLNG